MVRSTERSMPVPYKMSRDTRPRVSVKKGSAARTPREGCPYDLDLKWCDLPECVGDFGAHRGTARRPFPTM